MDAAAFSSCHSLITRTAQSAWSVELFSPIAVESHKTWSAGRSALAKGSFLSCALLWFSSPEGHIAFTRTVQSAWWIELSSPVPAKGRRACSAHWYVGGRIAICAEPAWKCHRTCAEHSGQKLLPVVVYRLWNQLNRARVVTESEKHKIHLQNMFASCHMGSMNLYTKFCLLNWSHIQWGASKLWHSLCQAWLGHVCKSDLVTCGQLTALAFVVTSAIGAS